MESLTQGKTRKDNRLPYYHYNTKTHRWEVLKVAPTLQAHVKRSVSIGGSTESCTVIRKSARLVTPKVAPEEKPKVLLPDKREMKQVGYHYIVYQTGNRRVGRRVKRTKISDSYHELLNWLFHKEKNFLVHPRTSDVVQPTSLLERQPEVFVTDKLSVALPNGDLVKLRVRKDGEYQKFLVKPYQKYHQHKNQQLRQGFRFKVEQSVKPEGKHRVIFGEEARRLIENVHAEKYDWDNGEWKPIDESRVKYKRTNQRKSVWFTRRSRRK